MMHAWLWDENEMGCACYMHVEVGVTVSFVADPSFSSVRNEKGGVLVTRCNLAAAVCMCECVWPHLIN